MGGVGSGSGRQSQYRLVENSLSITPATLFKEARAEPFRGVQRVELHRPDFRTALARIRVVPWHTFKDLFRVVVDIPHARIQQISLTAMPCPYGGQRWWLRCECGARCGKLYLPPGAISYACRQCHDLRYRSQRLMPSDRLRRRAERLWQRITPRGECRPRRPKWMRRTTYRRLCQAADTLDQDALAIGLAGLLRRLSK